MNRSSGNSKTDWKCKVAAYLHDPPHKPVGIRDHEQQRESFLNRFGLTAEYMTAFERSVDWQAAAADRLIFPDPARSGLRVDWKSSWMEFRHPLGGGQLKAGAFPPTAAQLETELTRALEAASISDSEDWQRRFIAGWRLWPELAAREKNQHFAYLVADTRIPDHTLWHHNALAAAFATCAGQPAFLIFQIGPVQDFIAQARKTQDLWSASYLLSFLIAQAMLAVADGIEFPDGTTVDGVGPDCIVFPQVRGLPMADYHWWKRGYIGDLKLRASHPNELLTPNLPNRFLALLPADRAPELAEAAERTVRIYWHRIADAVKTFIDAQLNGQCPDWAKHWDAQIARFPVVDWIIHRWSDTATAIKSAQQNAPPLHDGWLNHPLHHAFRWATEFIPPAERESFTPLSNSAFAWALHFAAAEWKFAALKAARSFSQWHEPGANPFRGIPKDHLDGKNEVLGGANYEQFWDILRQHPLLGEKTPGHPNAERHFVGRQLYGAISVVKRLWVRAFLSHRKDCPNGFFDFDVSSALQENFRSVVEIASGRSDPLLRDETEEDIQKLAPEESYYAVLAMDGDDMGQWVSGAKAAPLVNSLAEQAADYLKKHWPKHLPGLPEAGTVKRPLSPGYHAALSEALSNFSLYCAGPIVRAFDGRLIYCGGDDVLALLPGRKALECAHALQLAFRGIHPDSPDAHASTSVKNVLLKLFEFPAPGFIRCKTESGAKPSLKPNWPLLVMGPAATVSAGIAIGHVHSPMQATIDAAREAERTAKKIPGKGAFCLAVLKRSGESVSFSARWEHSIISVWDELESGIHNLSARFPHRYAALVKPLVDAGRCAGEIAYVQGWDNTLKDSVQAELRYVLRQQGDFKADKAAALAGRWCGMLTNGLSPRDYLHFWLAWAFVSRLASPKFDYQP